MSLDYPLYEEMKRQGLWSASVCWRLGDVLYYVGLLGAIVGPLAVAIGGALLDTSTKPLAQQVFLVGVVIFCLGVLSKKIAYYQARKKRLEVDA